MWHRTPVARPPLTPPLNRPRGLQRAHQRLQPRVIFGEHRMGAGMIVEADQLASVPAVERIGRVLGDDHRAIDGGVRADRAQVERALRRGRGTDGDGAPLPRSEENTSELQSLMRISYAILC